MANKKFNSCSPIVSAVPLPCSEPELLVHQAHQKGTTVMRNREKTKLLQVHLRCQMQSGHGHRETASDESHINFMLNMERIMMILKITIAIISQSDIQVIKQTMAFQHWLYTILQWLERTELASVARRTHWLQTVAVVGKVWRSELRRVQWQYVTYEHNIQYVI